jgi:hypothetical protein
MKRCAVVDSTDRPKPETKLATRRAGTETSTVPGQKKSIPSQKIQRPVRRQILNPLHFKMGLAMRRGPKK